MLPFKGSTPTFVKKITMDLKISPVGKKLPDTETCGMYYKHVTIVNDDSSIVSK
jgi:hypothetical protein